MIETDHPSERLAQNEAGEKMSSTLLVLKEIFPDEKVAELWESLQIELNPNHNSEMRSLWENLDLGYEYYRLGVIDLSNLLEDAAQKNGDNPKVLEDFLLVMGTSNFPQNSKEMDQMLGILTSESQTQLERDVMYDRLMGVNKALIASRAAPKSEQTNPQAKSANQTGYIPGYPDTFHSKSPQEQAPTSPKIENLPGERPFIEQARIIANAIREIKSLDPLGGGFSMLDLGVYERLLESYIDPTKSSELHTAGPQKIQYLIKGVEKELVSELAKLEKEQRRNGPEGSDLKAKRDAAKKNANDTEENLTDSRELLQKVIAAGEGEENIRIDGYVPSGEETARPLTKEEVTEEVQSEIKAEVTLSEAKKILADEKLHETQNAVNMWEQRRKDIIDQVNRMGALRSKMKEISAEMEELKKTMGPEDTNE